MVEYKAYVGHDLRIVLGITALALLLAVGVWAATNTVDDSNRTYYDNVTTDSTGNFKTELNQIKILLNNLERDSISENISLPQQQSQITVISEYVEHVRRIQELISNKNEYLNKTRDQLLSNDVPEVIIQRHDTFARNYQTSMEKLLTLSKTVENRWGEYPDQNPAVIELLDYINELTKQPEIRPLTEGVPFRSSGYEIPPIYPVDELNAKNAIEPKPNPSESKLKANSIDVLAFPTSYDLSETVDVQISQEIVDLASELDRNPLKIFNYVKNNIDYEPYYGSKKGSRETLKERRGNDYDLASLIIALYRASGIPARYVVGNVTIKPEDAMSLLDVDDPWIAAQVFATQGIPSNAYVDENDTIKFFEIEHVWVEAYIPYGNYRGILNDNTTPEWITLDPGLKKYSYYQDYNVPEEMGFDFNAFYEGSFSTVHNNTPLERYRQIITDYLATNHSGLNLTYADALTIKYRLDEDLEFLPNTLTYKSVQITGNYSELPDNTRHKIRFNISSGTNILLNYTINLPEFAGEQIVLSYVAATPADQAVIDSYGGIYNTPPYLVNLKPVLKIGDNKTVNGTGVGMGTNNNLNLDFIVKGKVVEHIDLEIIAGTAAGIGINSGDIPYSQYTNTNTTANETIAGQQLYRIARSYLERIDRHGDEIGSTMNVFKIEGPARAIVFNGIEVTYLGGVPDTFQWKGLRIDSSAIINVFSRSDNPSKNRKELFLLFGVESSLQESRIFEDTYNVDSISTVKGLGIAHDDSGMTVFKINSSNIGIIDGLNLLDSTKNILRTAVNSGQTVYTPDRKITYINWTGLVYITLNSTTGEAGYIIGEGLNGGYTAGTFDEVWKMCYADGSSLFTESKATLAINPVWFESELGCGFLYSGLKATLKSPEEGHEFKQNEPAGSIIYYESKYMGLWEIDWSEYEDIDTREAGKKCIDSKYGTNKKFCFNIKETESKIKKYRDFLNDWDYNRYDNDIIEAVDYWNKEIGQNLDYNLVKAIIWVETKVGYQIKDKNVMQLTPVAIGALGSGTDIDYFNLYPDPNPKKYTYLKYQIGDVKNDVKNNIHWGVRWLYHNQGRLLFKAGVGIVKPENPDEKWYTENWLEAARLYNGNIYDKQMYLPLSKTEKLYIRDIYKEKVRMIVEEGKWPDCVDGNKDDKCDYPYGEKLWGTNKEENSKTYESIIMKAQSISMFNKSTYVQINSSEKAELFPQNIKLLNASTIDQGINKIDLIHTIKTFDATSSISAYTQFTKNFDTHLISTKSISAVSLESTAINKGLNWLLQNQSSTGSWGDVNKTELRDTAIITETLQELGQIDTNYWNGIDWLKSKYPDSNDYLASQIIGMIGAKEKATIREEINSLKYRLAFEQNDDDGGFGYNDKYQSEVLTTLLAFEALNKSNYIDEGNNSYHTVAIAIYSIMGSQNPDGGWGFTKGSNSRVYTTSIVLDALEPYKNMTVGGGEDSNISINVSQNISQGLNWLKNMQNSDGGWSDDEDSITVYQTATAYYVILKLGASPLNNNGALNYLLSTQLPDGSWNSDPYSTALSLKALAKAKPLPDLVVTEIYPPTSKAGTNITIITSRISNVGRVNSSAFNVDFYLNDTYLATGTFSVGLSALTDTELVLTLNGNLNNSTSELKLVIDASNEIAELNENNNNKTISLVPNTIPKVTVVDSGGDVGGYSSLALDSNNNPHITYYNATNGLLKYAKYNGNIWTGLNIDYVGNGYNSLALDSANNPNIAYNSVEGFLKYIRYNGSNWIVSIIDSSGVVGRYVSLALDSNNTPHISYYDATNGDLKYAKYNGIGWEKTTVDSNGDVGGYTSISIDVYGKPHIAYCDGTNGDLKYAVYNGSNWNIDVVDSYGVAGEYTSLALDLDGNPHMSYLDGENKDLKYAVNYGYGWSIETIDSIGNVGYFTSLDMDSNGYPHIAYFDNTNLNLKYAKYSSEGWEISSIDSAGVVGGYASLALDSNDTPQVSYYDYSNRDLRYLQGIKIQNVTPPVLTSLTVSPTTISVAIGNTTNFTASPRDQYGAAISVTLTWNSSNNSVGTINDSTGSFTALAAGTTTISASNGSVNGTANVTVMLQPPDTAPPSTVTGLQNITNGQTYINFTWLNPPDPDFSHVMLYLNGSFKLNITTPQNYYNFTGLSPDTFYELGTHTVDTSGNVNETWVNATARTLNLSETAPPVVTSPTSNQSSLPTDTDNTPLWGETAQLNVTVTDDSGVASVTVNLSEIGGLAVKPMTNIGGNIWSTTTNASAGTSPKIYNLTVNATDTLGNSNTSVTIPLRVMKNGDCNGNGAVNSGDATRVYMNTSYPGNPLYPLSSPYVCDVTGNGAVNSGDATRIYMNTSYPGNPLYLLK